MFFDSTGVDFAQKQIGKKHLYTQKFWSEHFFVFCIMPFSPMAELQTSNSLSGNILGIMPLVIPGSLYPTHSWSYTLLRVLTVRALDN